MTAKFFKSSLMAAKLRNAPVEEKLNNEELNMHQFPSDFYALVWRSFVQNLDTVESDVRYAKNSWPC